VSVVEEKRNVVTSLSRGGLQFIQQIFSQTSDLLRLGSSTWV